MTIPVKTITADALLVDDAAPALPSFYVRDGESKTFRAISRELAQVGQHYRDRVETGSARPFLCRGEAVCAACLGGRRATLTFLLPVLYVPTRTVGVLSFGEAAGPDSLRRQIGQLLRLGDYTQKIFELANHSRKYTLKIVRSLSDAEDGEAFGLDALRDVVARGGLTPEALAATVDQVTNAEMLDESPSLRGEIKLRHPGIDVRAL